MIFLDAGHGGLDAKGHYTTAPNKMWNHRDKDTFHKNGVIYEGLLNRSIVKMIETKLTELRIPFMRVYDNSVDLPLAQRVRLANTYAKVHKSEQHIFISVHNNASMSQTARGSEVFTSPGQTKSDIWAAKYMQNLLDLIGIHGLSGVIIPRMDKFTDGDEDKEANFYVLTQTSMPAFLIECLFFDNLMDAQLIFNPLIQSIFAQAVVETIIEMYKL